MDFIYPKTLAELPPHYAEPADDLTRQFRPALEWQRLSPTVEVYRSKGGTGFWTLKGVPATRRHDVTHIDYQLPLAPDETYKDVLATMDTLQEGSVKWSAERAKISGQEVGYAFDLEHAKLFIDRMRRFSDDRPARQILLDAGFKLKYQNFTDRNLDVYSCQDGKRGEFSATLGADGFHLTHEKRSSTTGWENLLSLGFHRTNQDGSFAPLFLSPEISDPLAACADMAVYLVQNWRPEPTVGKPRRPR